MINSALLHNFTEDKVEFFYPCAKSDCFRYQKWGVVSAVRAKGGFLSQKKEYSYHFASVEKSVWYGNQCLSCSHFTGINLYKKSEPGKRLAVDLFIKDEDGPDHNGSR